MRQTRTSRSHGKTSVQVRMPSNNRFSGPCGTGEVRPGESADADRDGAASGKSLLMKSVGVCEALGGID